MQPSWTWRGVVAEVSPAARAGYVELLVPLGAAGADDPLLPGMSGRAPVDVQRTSIAGAAARAARRVLRTDFLL